MLHHHTFLPIQRNDALSCRVPPAWSVALLVSTIAIRPTWGVVPPCWESIKLATDHTDAGDNFGYGVAMDGDVMAVGSPFYRVAVGIYHVAGQVEILRRSADNTWTSETKIQGPVDYLFGNYIEARAFGASLALQGDSLIIGDPQHYHATSYINGLPEVGTVFAYKWINGVLTYVGRLENNPPVAHAGFGSSVAVYGSWLAVKEEGSGYPVVHVFKWSGTNWEHKQKLTPPLSGNNFYGSVAIYGSFLVVGTYRGAYVFILDNTGTWVLSRTLVPSDDALPWTGSSVAIIAGTRIMVGAPDADIQNGVTTVTDAGAAYVFERSPLANEWYQTAKLQAEIPVANGRFGWQVALHSNLALIGSNPNSGLGYAHLFAKNGSNWYRTAGLSVHDPVEPDNPTDRRGFGFAVAVTDAWAAVGDHLADDLGTNAGAVYLYDMTDEDHDGVPDFCGPGPGQNPHSYAYDNCSPFIGPNEENKLHCEKRNCANPSQADADGDGVGDTCDNCTPTNPWHHCSGDRCKNWYQEDQDVDGVGDACDNCVSKANGPFTGICVSGANAGDACCTKECAGGVNSGVCCGISADCPGSTCAASTDCAGSVCSMKQDDQDGDGVGDVCDNCPSEANSDTQDDDLQLIRDNLTGAILFRDTSCPGTQPCATYQNMIAAYKTPWGVASSATPSLSSESPAEHLRAVLAKITESALSCHMELFRVIADKLFTFEMLLGNEAFADAMDPTIGVGGALDANDLGSLYAFEGASGVSSQYGLLDETLALLRGRDLCPNGNCTQATQWRGSNYSLRYPYYNRLRWNIGNMAYGVNYGFETAPTEADAAARYPQGHGDAYGYYLKAEKVYLDAIVGKHGAAFANNFVNTLSEVSETVEMDDDWSVPVPFRDVSNLAVAMAARARTASRVVELTFRREYETNTEQQHYEDAYQPAQQDRAWGTLDWGRRGALGAYLDWAQLSQLTPIPGVQVSNPAPGDPVPFPFADNFDDNVANGFHLSGGTWGASSQRLNVKNVGVGQMGLALLTFSEPIPSAFEVSVSAKTNLNEFVVFATSPTEFKFAGGRYDTGSWAIGKFSSGHWSYGSIQRESIDASAVHVLRVRVDGTNVKLFVDGAPDLKVEYTFPDALSRTQIGFGVHNSTSGAGPNGWFDDFQIGAVVDGAAYHNLSDFNRATVHELGELASAVTLMQERVDAAGAGLNPLGLIQNVVPFGMQIASDATTSGRNHYKQVAETAKAYLDFAHNILEWANENNERLRNQENDIDIFSEEVLPATEADAKSTLVGIFGTPYPDDPIDNDLDPTSPTGEDEANAPDLVHFLLTDELAREQPWYVSGEARISPGEIQIAMGKLRMAEIQGDIAQEQLNAHAGDLEDAVQLLEQQSHVAREELRIMGQTCAEELTLMDELSKLRTSCNFWCDLKKGLGAITSIATAVVSCAGPQAAAFCGPAVVGAVSSSADGLGKLLDTSQADEIRGELDIEKQRIRVECMQNAKLTSLRNQLVESDLESRVNGLIRRTPELQLNLAMQGETTLEAMALLRAAIHKGQMKLSDRNRLRDLAVHKLEKFRWHDLAFRVFRNNALREYAAFFDFAAMWVYLEVRAYTYEYLKPEAETDPLASKVLRELRLGRTNGTDAGLYGLHKTLENNALTDNFNIPLTEAPTVTASFKLDLLGLDRDPIQRGKQFSVDDVTNDVLKSVGHGFETGAIVVVASDNVLPGGLVDNGQEYCLVKITDDTFTLYNTNDCTVVDPSIRVDIVDQGTGPHYVALSANRAFRDWMADHIVPKMEEVPEVINFAETNLVNSGPAIVVRFSTETTNNNLFGYGGPGYGTTKFPDLDEKAHKMRNFGLRFVGAEDSGLFIQNPPYLVRLYLMPLGESGIKEGADEVRFVSVADQWLPSPPGDVMESAKQPEFNPWKDALGHGTNGEPFGTAKRFSDATGLAGSGEPQGFWRADLAGRIVWNTRWVLVIPASQFTAETDANKALKRFIYGRQADPKKNTGLEDIEWEIWAYKQ